jgi:hypothetical protein
MTIKLTLHTRLSGASRSFFCVGPDQLNALFTFHFQGLRMSWSGVPVSVQPQVAVTGASKGFGKLLRLVHASESAIPAVAAHIHEVMRLLPPRPGRESPQ